jgi:glucose-6-phosphate 1-dehydrogenase
MTPASQLVILGAGGDLTGRYLLPALGHLQAAGLLPERSEVLGVDRAEQDDDAFRRSIGEQLARHAPDLDERARHDLCARSRYLTGDVSDPDVLARAAEGTSGPVVFYLALPPAVFEPAIRGIVDLGPGRGDRLVVEKPFGTDLASARALNRLVDEAFDEDRVFRIDHFLGMRTVQNLLGIRFANRLFEPSWSADHIESIDIVWDETVALEGRAGYYDHTGAVRDMVQNHLLQLLALAAMEEPASLGAGDLRDAKVAALRSVRPMTADDVARRTSRARYGPGRIGGRDLPAYVDEDGVDGDRSTETFAAVELHVDTDRWRGVPFRLRTGKALAADRHEIRFTFRPTGSTLFGPQGAQPVNHLTMAIDPDRLVVGLALNGSHDPTVVEPAELTAECGPSDLPTYARLLLDVFDGDPAFSIRGDEVEESWRVVEPILAAWGDGAVPLLEYPAGSAGPGADR